MQKINNLIREKGGILIVILFIGAIIFVQHSDKKSKMKRENLNLMGGLSIGEFTGRSYYTTNGGGVNAISYSFIVNLKEFTGADTRCDEDSPNASDAFHSSKKADVGDRFLVLYDMDNPDKSIIRLDYPVKDSADFKRYVNEFEYIRKK